MSKFVEVKTYSPKGIADVWLIDLEKVARMHLNRGLVVFDDGGAMNIDKENAARLAAELKAMGGDGE